MSWGRPECRGSRRESQLTKDVGEVRRAGVRRGEEALAEQPASRAAREAEGGRSRAVFLGMCRRSAGGAHPDPRRPGPGEPLPHPPGRGPLRPRGARRAGTEGEEARLGK